MRPPIHLVVDGRCIRETGTGVGNAALRQLEGIDLLLEKPEWRAAWQVSVLRDATLLHSKVFRQRWNRFKNLLFVEAPASPESHPAGDWWLQFRLPKMLRDAAADVIYSPAYVGPLRTGKTRRIVMVHDDLAWSAADSYPLKFRLYIQLMTHLCANAANAVLFPSADARERVLRHVPIKDAQTRARVLPHGLDLRIFNVQKETARERVMLCIANSEPRKNHDILFRILPLLKDTGIRLQLLGFHNVEPERLKRLAAIAPSGWEILPASDDRSVADWLRKASLLVLPSRGEGFGFPVIEAMATGTPMILSDLPVFREVAGDAAVYYKPDDDLGWEAAVREVLAGSERVSQRIELGIERVKRYSLEACGTRLLDLAKELVTKNAD